MTQNASATVGYTMESYDVNTSAPDPNNPGKKMTIKLTPAKCPKFDITQAGLDAAVSYYSDQGGIAFVMEKFNLQTGTDARNAIRSAFNKGPSEEQLQREALGRITTNPQLMAQLQSIGGDVDRIQSEVFKPVIEQLRSEYAAKKAQSVAQPDTTDEEANATA